MKKSILFLPVVFFLLSCSVQKRQYQKGYFISWHKHSSPSAESKEKITRQDVYKKQTSPEIVLKNTENKTEIFASVPNELKSRHFEKFKKYSSSEDSCDVILFKDGSEIRARIIEITGTTVKYKKCSMPEGPAYVSNKTELFMIKYANGIKEVIKTPESTYNSKAQNKNEKQKQSKKNTKLSTVALVFAILGFYGLNLIGGVVAIILSSIQLYKIKMYPDLYGAGRKALISLIMGIISVLLWGLIILAIAFLI